MKVCQLTQIVAFYYLICLSKFVSRKLERRILFVGSYPKSVAETMSNPFANSQYNGNMQKKILPRRLLTNKPRQTQGLPRPLPSHPLKPPRLKLPRLKRQRLKLPKKKHPRLKHQHHQAEAVETKSRQRQSNNYVMPLEQG